MFFLLLFCTKKQKRPGLNDGWGLFYNNFIILLKLSLCQVAPRLKVKKM